MSKDAEFKMSPLDKGDEAEMRFLFDARTRPSVAKLLFGVPPSSMEFHRRWVEANVPARRLMYVARLGGRLAGYCHAYGFEGDEVEVGFVVHPDFQGRGCGGRMVEELVIEMGRLMPDKKVVLKVRSDNSVAIGTYERRGFEKTGEEGGVLL